MEGEQLKPVELDESVTIVRNKFEKLTPFMVQLTVSANPLAMVGWRYKPES
jgi:hypothetical protein